MIRRNFRRLRKFIAPTWLTEEEGELVGYSIDLLKDGALQRLYLGLLSRFPQNGPNGETAPPDALAALGRDRRVVRGIFETPAEYALRLVNWLVDRRKAGSAFALLQKLSEYTGPGFAFRTYDARGNCFSRDVDGVETTELGTTWDWDGEPERWARFWVVVYPTALWSTTARQYANVATPDWNPNAGQWGVNMDREHIRTLQSIVADWKPEHAECVHIIIAFDPASFDPAAPEPDGTWGSWGKIVGGQRVPARLATARYLNGV